MGYHRNHHIATTPRGAAARRRGRLASEQSLVQHEGGRPQIPAADAQHESPHANDVLDHREPQVVGTERPLAYRDGVVVGEGLLRPSAALAGNSRTSVDPVEGVRVLDGPLFLAAATQHAREPASGAHKQSPNTSGSTNFMR